VSSGGATDDRAVVDSSAAVFAAVVISVVFTALAALAMPRSRVGAPAAAPVGAESAAVPPVAGA
jgi:hypothetical protein